MEQRRIPGRRKMTKVSPIMILGIILFALPTITNIFRFHLPKWIGTIGIILISIGAIHSLIKTIKGD